MFSRLRKKPVEETSKNLFIVIASSVLIACAITAIAIIVAAILLTYTSMTENTLPLIITVSCVISSVVAGFDTAKGVDSRGWMWGLLSGGIFAIVLIFVEVWISGTVSFDMRTITLMALSVAGGGLGGILGINFKK